MSRKKSYVIDIPPMPWQRPGLCGTRFYDKQREDKTYCGLIIQKQHGDEPIFEKAIYIDLIFYVQIHKTKKRDLTHHILKPDLDNYIKFALDMLVSGAEIISDDKIVCQISAEKKWDIRPRTEITIIELE